MKNQIFKNVKIVLLLCIVVTVVAVIVVFAGYRRVMDEGASLVSSIQDGAEMAISKVRQTAVRNGVTEWRLDAVSAEYLNAENLVVFEGPSVVFFKGGGENVVMTAVKGLIRTDSNNIRVSGDVVVKEDDCILKTESLSYDNEGRVFFTDAPVALSGAGFDLTADSASLDMRRQQVVLKGNVRGILSENIEL